MRRVRIGVRPNKSNVDQFAVKGVLTVKLAATVLELADLGCNDGAIFGVGPIKAPLVGLRIVKTEGQTFDVAACAISFELFKLGAAFPNFSSDGRAIKIDPGIRAGQRVQAALQVNFPAAQLKIKIVLAIPLGGWLGVRLALRIPFVPTQVKGWLR